MGKEAAKFNLDALGIRAEGIPDYAGKGTLSTMAQIKQVMYEGIVQTIMSATSTSSSEELYSGALSLLGFRDTNKTNLGVGLGFGYSQVGTNYETSFTLSPTKEVTTTTQKVDAKAVETAQKAYEMQSKPLKKLNQQFNQLKLVTPTQKQLLLMLANTCQIW